MIIVTPDSKYIVNDEQAAAAITLMQKGSGLLHLKDQNVAIKAAAIMEVKQENQPVISASEYQGSPLKLPPKTQLTPEQAAEQQKRQRGMMAEMRQKLARKFHWPDR